MQKFAHPYKMVKPAHVPLSHVTVMFNINLIQGTWLIDYTCVCVCAREWDDNKSHCGRCWTLWTPCSCRSLSSDVFINNAVSVCVCVCETAPFRDQDLFFQRRGNIFFHPLILPKKKGHKFWTAACRLVLSLNFIKTTDFLFFCQN